jgi:hypothetical protein
LQSLRVNLQITDVVTFEDGGESKEELEEKSQEETEQKIGKRRSTN